MKKYLLSLTMLLAAAGAWADPTTVTAVDGLNNTSFYTIKSVNRGFLYYDETHPNNVTSSSHTNLVNATPSNTESATEEQFAFLRGDYTPDGQYYLYNRKAHKFVSWAGGNTVALTLTDEPQRTWTVELNSATYFTIKVPGTTQQYINITNWGAQYGCKVFSTNADDGNKMTITNVCTAEEDANAALAKVKLKEGKALIQTGLGYPKTTSDAYTTLNGMAYEGATLTAVEAAVSAYISCTDIALPESGKAYTIKAWWKTRQLPMTYFETTVSGVFQGQVPSYGPNSTANVEATKLVCQEVDGKYLFVSDNGYYFGWQADGKGKTTATTYNANQLFNIKKAYIHASFGDAKNNVTLPELLGKVCLQNTSNHNLMFSFASTSKKYHSGDAQSTYYSDNAHTVYYTIEPVAETDYTTNVLNVNAAAQQTDGSYVSTFYAPYATKLPEGYTAYTIQSVNEDNTKANMTQLETEIPANTGVIITSETSGQVRLELSTTNPAAPTVNMLHGSVGVSYQPAALAYVLATGSHGVGLYKPTPNKDENGGNGTTHFKNNAGKAYLQLTEESHVKAFTFSFGDDIETGIEDINGAEDGAKAVIYDLSGRRVQKAGKGLYIINGKKVIL